MTTAVSLPVACWKAGPLEHGVQLVFIRPGRPVENGFIESFNGRLRDEFLNVEWLASLEEARRKLAAWASPLQPSTATQRAR